MVAQAMDIMATPMINTLIIKTGRAPNLSIHQPTAGDKTNAANAPALTDPLISVRLQPNSWDRGNMKIVRVVMLGAILAKIAVLDAPTTTQP